MAKQRPDKLQDLSGISPQIEVTCLHCGRKGRFLAAEMLEHFRKRNWSTLFAHASARFTCTGPVGQDKGCGRRGVSFRAVPPPPLPPAPPAPVMTDREIRVEIRRRRG